MKRLDFIRHSAAALGTISMAHPFLNNLTTMPKKLPSLGLGLFTLPKLLEQDFKGTLSKLSAMGYEELEFFGPYSFSHKNNKESWAQVTPMLGFNGSGLFGETLESAAKILKKNKLRVPAMHTDLDTLEQHMGALAEAANVLGAKYVVLPSAPPETRLNLDGYKSLAERFNKIGESAQQYGISYAYHNHGYGLQEVNGIRPLDLILDGTDPSLVFFEMDLFWTVAGRANPVELLKNNPGRYKMLHIKDMKTQSCFATDGGNPQEWMALFPQLTTAGQGVIDLPAILKTAIKTGVDHYFVEQDLAPNPWVDIQNSYDYLKKLRF